MPHLVINVFDSFRLKHMKKAPSTPSIFKVAILLSLFVIQATASTEIQRYSFSEWSGKIGYSEAVAVDNTLYLSGIVGEGDTMEESLSMALGRLDGMLSFFNLSKDCVLKEKIYTNDQKALRKATGIRKEYYNGEFPVALWIEVETHRENAWVEIEYVIHLPKNHKLPPVDK